MTISEHALTFAHRPIREFDPDGGLDDPTGVAWRISSPPDEGGGWQDVFSAFLDQPESARVAAIVVGPWYEMWDNSSAEIIAALAAAEARLPYLRGIFLGDITYDEYEISWIQNDDVSPLLSAYPQLEFFQVRGGTGLTFGGPFAHPNLKSLVIEAGGLPAEVVREVLGSDLPELEHLELWLGTDNYGGDATVDDLEPLLSGSLFPKLRTLGIRNAEIADDIAQRLAEGPLLGRLEALDLSLGTLSDEGAEALLQNSAFARLKRIDLHYHFLSDEILARLQELGPEVNLADRQGGGDSDDRYCAVTE